MSIIKTYHVLISIRYICEHCNEEKSHYCGKNYLKGKRMNDSILRL
jgi:hypothetical protein